MITNNKTYYIIDFSNWVYRFKSVYPFSKIENRGVVTDTSVLFGFARVLPLLPYTDIVVVLDGVPSISRRILPAYKGQRLHDEQSEGTRISNIDIVRWLSNVGTILHKTISVVCSPGQETDEVIASIVYRAVGKLPSNSILIDMLYKKPIESDRMLKQYAALQKEEFLVEENSRCIIASTDGDFLQLQRFENVFIDLSLTGKDISNKHTSKSTDGLSPVQTILHKTIFGDVSDNIPSVQVNSKQKSQIKEWIKNIDSEETLNKALQAIWVNPTSELEIVLFSQRRITKVNYEVAHLVYRGNPIKLSEYEEPLKLLNKYKIRIRCPKVL